VLSAVLAHTGWHWMSERGADFLAYEMVAPSVDPAFFATLLRWAMLALIVVAAAWLLKGGFGWLAARFPGLAATDPEAAPAGARDAG